MKKGYKDKQISDADQIDKAAHVEETEQVNLRCLRECVVLGYGLFKPGQIVTDREAVEYLRGKNPNFEDTKEVA